ncbi:MAG: CbtA family protein, partial [Reyranellales bacterium]
MLVALTVGRRLVLQFGAWDASLVGGVAFIVLIMAAMLLLPEINEVPAQFPADLLWRFRITSIGIEAVLWAAIGLVFGRLADTVLRSEQRGLWSRQRV